MPNNIFGFFGLRENPFKINPDPRFLFLTPALQSASDALTYAIETRKGLVLLTGEVGTGKTILVRCLLNRLSEQKMPTALIFNARLNPDNLLDLILNDFGIPCSSTLKSEKLIHLNTWLLERYRDGQIPVLVVDEAQGMPIHVLEEVRLLMNFETPRDKLLQIVLAGQPELNDTLKRHELRQLRQRITIRCKTVPLTPEQTYGYMNERLRVAGATVQIFDPQSMGFVHSCAHGIPRVINVLCEHALINACADGSKLVSPSHVEQAARDCQLEKVDSVSRILNTGSYARTSLDEIGSILSRVSAENSMPESSAPKFPPRFETQPSFISMQHPQTEAKLDCHTGPGPVRQSPVYPAPAVQGVPQPLPQWAAGTLRLLRLWPKSFAADAEITLRQLRKWLYSASLRYWLPIRRELRLRFESLQASISRFLADPRWAKWENQLSRSFESAWRNTNSHLQSWLARPFRSRPRSRQIPSSDWRTKVSNSLARANRRRVASLRRWLQEPINSRLHPLERSPDDAARRSNTQNQPPQL